MASRGQAPGRRPRRVPGPSTLRARLDHRRRRLRRRHRARDRLVHQGRRPDLGRQPGPSTTARSSTCSPRRTHDGSGRSRQFTSASRPTHRRLRHPRRRPAGLPGQHQRPHRAARPGCPPNIITQGGAIFANAYARNLQITNNVVAEQRRRLRHHPHRHARPRGAGHQPAQRGRPDRQQPDRRQRRHQPRRRRSASSPARTATRSPATTSAATSRSSTAAASASTACSPNGSIHHNRIYFNKSNDEGGGIMIAGQLPADPDDLSPGIRPGRPSTPT